MRRDAVFDQVHSQTVDFLHLLFETFADAASIDEHRQRCQQCQDNDDEEREEDDVSLLHVFCFVVRQHDSLMQERRVTLKSHGHFCDAVVCGEGAQRIRELGGFGFEEPRVVP